MSENNEKLSRLSRKELVDKYTTANNAGVYLFAELIRRAFPDEEEEEVKKMEPVVPIMEGVRVGKSLTTCTNPSTILEVDAVAAIEQQSFEDEIYFIAVERVRFIDCKFSMETKLNTVNCDPDVLFKFCSFTYNQELVEAYLPNCSFDRCLFESKREEISL